jgi:hypothetical protein
VNKYSLKWGFEEACKRAKIAYGAPNPDDGLIWHDLRRTFATRLRANGVHEYDIKYLLHGNWLTLCTVLALIDPRQDEPQAYFQVNGIELTT